MNIFTRKINFKLVSIIQIIFFILYLTFNILNVGEMGTALSFLAIFIVLAGIELFTQIIQVKICIKKHFIFLLLFVVWLSVRVIVDLNDLEHLKQIIIATTGGILLFFLIGTFIKSAIEKIFLFKKPQIILEILLLFILACVLVIFTSLRLRLVRSDIFYIQDVHGSYQRPGNFLTILFMILSFIYSMLLSYEYTKKIGSILLYSLIYSSAMFFSLISSQLFGSNAATANILAIYLITIVLAIISSNKKFRLMYIQKKLRFPNSKKLVMKIIKVSIFIIVVFALIGFAMIKKTGFDLTKTRAFGFGSGENTSVTSRFNILKETGIAQMSYAPLLGNVNVAYLTTGNAGRTLHNLIPNIIAELGLVGLLIFSLLLISIFRILLKNIRNKNNSLEGFQKNMTNYWLFFVLIFLFLYANISVGKSWSVMWFFLGFSVSMFDKKSIINF